MRTVSSSEKKRRMAPSASSLRPWLPTSPTEEPQSPDRWSRENRIVEPEHRRSVAVYLELAFRQDEQGYSADRAFVRFLLALRSHVERLVLMGRVDPEPGRAPYAIPDDVDFAPLPHYPSLHHVAGVVRAVPATRRAVRRAIADVDVVWAIGPHPMSIPVARIALGNGKRVVLGVRQHFPDYVRHRLPSARWKPALAAAHVLESAFRRLSRRVPVIAV